MIGDPQKQLPQTFRAIEQIIRAYTTYTLNAFKNVAIAKYAVSLVKSKIALMFF